MPRGISSSTTCGPGSRIPKPAGPFTLGRYQVPPSKMVAEDRRSASRMSPGIGWVW